MQKRFVVLSALACALSLVGGRAQASYNYTTALTLSSPNAGVVINNALGTASLGGTTITFLPQAGNKAVPSLNSLNLGDVNVTSTAGVAPVSFDVNFVDTTTITNVPPPGTATPLGTLVFTGTVNLSGVSPTTGTVLASNLVVTTSSTTAGGNTFAMSSPSFASPTVNGAGGSVSALISATQPPGVPAPASIVMLGLGMGAMGIVRVGRRFLAA